MAGKYSPSPWSVAEHRKAYALGGMHELPLVVDANGIDVARVMDSYSLTRPARSQEEFEANARLIAVSPDQHEILEAGLNLLGGWRELIALLDDMPKDEAVGKAMWAALDQMDNWKQHARAAIAKAQPS